MKRFEIIAIFKEYLDNVDFKPIDFSKFREALQDTIKILSDANTERYCNHCSKVCNDVYMLKDEVWLDLMNNDRGFLHLECIEYLLGRDLVYNDFSGAKCNSSIKYLLSRFGD